MKAISYLVLIFAICFLIAPNAVQAGEPTWVRIEVNSMKCIDTTEASEDEPFFIVSGYWNHDDEDKIEPHYTKAYDIDDDHPPLRHIKMKGLGSYPGNSAELAIVFMEQDGGSADTWVQIGLHAAAIIYGGAEAQVAKQKALTVWGMVKDLFHDSDDVLGVIYCRIEWNKNGTISQEWGEVERCVYDGANYYIGRSDDKRNNDLHKFTLSGDGSKYEVYMKAFIE